MNGALRILVATAAMAAVLGCGHTPSASDGGPDAGATDGGIPPCVSNPVSPVDILNACTNVQTGDPAKDCPYFPALAPGGNLPSLP